jgi:hypothetical protein
VLDPVRQTPELGDDVSAALLPSAYVLVRRRFAEVLPERASRSSIA